MRGSIWRTLIPVLAILALVVAACAPAPAAQPTAAPTPAAVPKAAAPTTAPTAAPAQPTSAPKPAAQPVEITVLEHQEPRVKLLQQLIPKFEAETAAKGTPIKVRLLEGPAPDREFRTKLTVDYNAGNAADVTSFPNSWAPDFIAAGYLLDLTSRLKAWPDFEKAYYPVLREQMVRDDGKIYTLVREASVQQLFYRKDVLQANGISTEQPKTWADLLERGRQIKAKTGKPPILFPAATAWGGGTFDEGFIHLMLGTGSPLYNEKTGKWVVRSPGLLSVFKFYESLAKDDLIPVQPLLAPEPWVALKYKMFPAGDLVVTTCGSWCWIFDWGEGKPGEIKDLFNKVATWQFPSENGQPHVWAGMGWQWAIHSKTKNPDAAFEFVKWMASGDRIAENLAVIGSISPRNDVATIKPYSEKSFLVEAEKLLTQGKFFRARTGIDKLQRGVGVATEEIITGRATAEQALEKFVSMVTAELGADKVEEMR